jgi:hypothetical protein
MLLFGLREHLFHPTYPYRSTGYDCPAYLDILEVMTASRLDGVDRLSCYDVAAPPDDGYGSGSP